jgi:hypothetical protein
MRLQEAIAARNRIVHRGHNDQTGSQEERRLWEHVVFTREVIVRLVLTALEFHGQYISFVGGYHFSRFPPHDSGTPKSAVART